MSDIEQRVKKMNKIIYTLLTIITLSCVTTNANAYSYFGIYQCGEWVNAKNEGENSPRYVQMKVYFSGYISGLALGYRKDVLKNTKFESAALWVDNYCSANPLKGLLYAGLQLFIALRKQEGL